MCFGRFKGDQVGNARWHSLSVFRKFLCAFECILGGFECIGKVKVHFVRF